jgi:hypothetical protein
VILAAFLDAAGPQYPEEYWDEQDHAANAFAELYYEREWLQGFGLTAAISDADKTSSL